MAKHRVEFPDTNFAPQEIEAGCSLAEQLTVENSPLLFGCRTGICGTCLISLDPSTGSGANPADKAEREVLEMLVPDEAHARLACQIRIQGDLKIRVLEESP